MTDRKRLTAEQYAKAKAAGLTDADMQEDGYDLPSGGADFSDVKSGSASAAAMTPDEQAAYGRAERYATNYGMIDTALRHAALGFGDELRSAMGATKDVVTGAGEFGPSYRGRERAEQAGMQKFAVEHPQQNLAATLAGSVASALGSGGPVGAVLKRVAGGGGTALRAARAGAVYGAATGAGEADGGASDRLAGAAMGAGTGAVAGAALHGTVGLGQSVWRALTQSGEERAAERANALIVDRMRQGGETPGSVAARAADSRTNGKPDALLDLAGEPITRLGRDATGFPTKGASELTRFVGDRMADQPERVVGDLARTGKMTRVNTNEAIETLAQERRALSEPMYQVIRNVEVDHPQLRPLFELPDFRKAYALAEKVADRYAAVGEGQPLPPLEALFPAPSTGRAIVPAGIAPVGAPTPKMTIGTLDQVKRAIDDVLYVEKKRMGPTDAASLKRVRHALVMIGDDATRDASGKSAYYEARRVFEGPTKLMEQLEDGGTHFLGPKTTPADVAAHLKTLGDAEREAYKASVLDGVATKLDNARSGRDVAALLDTPNTAKKLQLLFDDPKDYQAWRAAFETERGYGATRNLVAGGSRTTPMAAGMADIEGAPNDLLVAGAKSASTAKLSPIAAALWRRATAGWRGIRSASTADAIAQKLRVEARNEAEFTALMQELEDLGRTQAARSQVSGRVARAAGAAAGGLIR